MYKTTFIIVVMLCLIGCQTIDEESISIEQQTKQTIETLPLDTADINEIRIIKPDLSNLSNQNVLITLNDQNTIDNLKQILNNAVYKSGAFEDIRHDYEIEILKKNGSSFSIRYWVKFKRFEADIAKNYIIDTETANKMNSFLKSHELE